MIKRVSSTDINCTSLYHKSHHKIRQKLKFNYKIQSQGKLSGSLLIMFISLRSIQAVMATWQLIKRVKSFIWNCWGDLLPLKWHLIESLYLTREPKMTPTQFQRSVSYCITLPLFNRSLVILSLWESVALLQFAWRFNSAGPIISACLGILLNNCLVITVSNQSVFVIPTYVFICLYSKYFKMCQVQQSSCHWAPAT